MDLEWGGGISQTFDSIINKTIEVLGLIPATSNCWNKLLNLFHVLVLFEEFSGEKSDPANVSGIEEGEQNTFIQETLKCLVFQPDLELTGLSQTDLSIQLHFVREPAFADSDVLARVCMFTWWTFCVLVFCIQCRWSQTYSIFIEWAHVNFGSLNESLIMPGFFQGQY